MSPEEEWDLAVIMMQVHGDGADQWIAGQIATYDQEGDSDRADRFRRLSITVNEIRTSGDEASVPSSSTLPWLPD